MSSNHVRVPLMVESEFRPPWTKTTGRRILAKQKISQRFFILNPAFRKI